MIIEKLAQYKDRPQVIFNNLLQAWKERGFDIVSSQEKDWLIHCTGRSYSRIRVDLLTQCLDLQDETLVQIVYSPRLTPAVSRPVNISPAGQEKIHSDLDQKMTAVLDQVGEWTPVPRQELESTGRVLPDPYFVSANTRGRGRGVKLRMFFGLAMAVLGALMGYLNLNGILALGSFELWFVIAVAGVFVFCLGLFNWVWRR